MKGPPVEAPERVVQGRGNCPHTASVKNVVNVHTMTGALPSAQWRDSAPQNQLPPKWTKEVLSHLLAKDPLPVYVIAPAQDVDDVSTPLTAALRRYTPRWRHAPTRVRVVLEPSRLKEMLRESKLSQDQLHKEVLVVLDRHPDPGLSEVRGLAKRVADSLHAPLVVVVPARAWEDLGEGERPAALLPGAVLVDARPRPGSPELVSALREDARLLSAFHSVTIPDSTVLAAALAPPKDEGCSQPLLGRRLLDQWATWTVLDGDDYVRPRSGGEPLCGRSACTIDEQALTCLLRSEVVGQDESCAALSRHVVLGRSGMRLESQRPRSAVMLAGSTGTGKTLLAQTLVNALREHGQYETHLIRVDMGALTSGHLSASLLGSPPGYVGSENREQWLTSRIARTPSAVLLLDEVDKADPELRDALLLELLGNGTVTDYSGRTVDATGLDVILTANTGAGTLTRAHTGFGEGGDRMESAEAELRRLLPPEVFNRLDEVIFMRPFDRVRMMTVLNRLLERFEEVIRAGGFCVTVEDEVRDWLVNKALARPDGARRLHREVERHLVVPLLGQVPGSYRAVMSAGTPQVIPDAASTAG